MKKPTHLDSSSGNTVGNTKDQGTIRHPSRDIVGTQGTELLEKRIVLCVTGSVAAYKAVDMARLLMRHGADVFPVTTGSVTRNLLKPDLLKWATGNEPVTKLTGDLEHILLADYGMSDLILIYPCTANTIGKLANGIDDTPVTSVLAVALGSKIPILIAPAMHEAMYDNKFIRENVVKLRASGVQFIEPKISEGKAKVAPPEEVLEAVFSSINSSVSNEKMLLEKGNQSLSSLSLLITAGSTVEYIDPIRVVTNLSSGKMGTALATEASKMGSRVKLIYGHGYPLNPSDSGALNVSYVNTADEMRDSVISELESRKYDAVFMTAAVTDFTPARKSAKKIDTRNTKSLNLRLVRTKKIVDQAKKISKGTFLVAFKADHMVSDDLLVERAFKKLQESDADLVVANDVGRKGSEIGSELNEVFIVDRRKNIIHLPLQSKTSIAKKILQIVGEQMRPNPA